jgi:uncharacterized protein
MAEYPKAWIDYLIHFHTDQDFFECHEVLEEHWKNEGMKGNGWPGLIQIAVALYHQRRHNMNGAKRMMNSGINRLKEEKDFLAALGLQTAAFLEILEERKKAITHHEKYEPVILPLTESVLKKCKEEAIRQGKQWGKHAAPDEHVIHKHKLRDRTSVIDERIKQKQLKNRTI